jgi:CUG-BP- and ETR3-like factor
MSQEEVNALTLDQLKEELSARNLDATGLKTAMVERLLAALEEEKAAAAALAEQKAAAAAAAAEQAANQPCKLFVGQVPSPTTEQQIRDVFSPYGTIQEIQFMIDRATNQPKGCCFIVFANEASAQNAIDNLHEKVALPGAKRSMIVNKHTSKSSGGGGENKLYVGMLSRSTTEQEVRQMFEPYGTVNEVFMMTDKQTGANKGQCFVKFANRSDAQRAIAALHDTFRDKDAPSNVQVRFAHTPQEKQMQMANQQPFGMFGGAGFPGFAGLGGMGGMGAMGGMGQGFDTTTFGQLGMPGMNPGMYGQVPGFGMPKPATPKTAQAKGPPGSNLFVLGIPENYGDLDLGNLFSNFGNVLSSKVQVDLQTGNSKGFGFVSFDNVTAAQAAISSMDGFMLGTKRLQVRVKKGDGGAATTTTGYRPY